MGLQNKIIVIKKTNPIQYPVENIAQHDSWLKHLQKKVQ